MNDLTRGVSVKAKLTISFLIVALLGALIGGIGIYSLSQANATAEKMYRYETLGIRYASDAKSQIVAVGRELRNVFVASSEEERLGAIENIRKLFDSVEEDLNLAQKSFSTPEGLAYLNEVRQIAEKYEQNINAILTQIDDQSYFYKSLLVQQIVDTVEPVAADLEASINRALNQKENVAQNYSQDIATSFIYVRNGLFTITGLGVLAALLLGFFLTRGIIRQLGGEPADVSAIANAIAQGKLYTRIDLSQAALGSVMQSMHQMQESLRQTVIDVLSSSDNIAVGTSQIASGNLDLSRRTEEQATNVTETAAAMEEITSTVRSNADAAREAAGLAQVVRSSAASGQTAVGEVITSMQGMQSSSEQIVNIINVIDSIAFQTNILALNAAVEAARAGTEGRGFAVVASEVRTLAQRSASAAQDIKHLIDESVNKVNEGNQKVHLAGSTIQSMVEQVNQVAALIDEISAATIEQNAGVEQVSQAIGQLEAVTQQNSALVEESAVAANTLSDQAVRLVEVVSVFDLGDTIHVSAKERHLKNYESFPALH